jgi:hypothetical protein
MKPVGIKKKVLLGKDPLKCTIHDEKDIVLNKVFFPYNLIPIQINELKKCQLFYNNNLDYHILSFINIIHFVS